uniref:Uncharacterized protein n=1 Tax=Megaselia scalaris TaxID=36166 RepID=T1GIV1_MEGSC
MKLAVLFVGLSLFLAVSARSADDAKALNLLPFIPITNEEYQSLRSLVGKKFTARGIFDKLSTESSRGLFDKFKGSKPLCTVDAGGVNLGTSSSGGGSDGEKGGIFGFFKKKKNKDDTPTSTIPSSSGGDFYDYNYDYESFPVAPPFKKGKGKQTTHKIQRRRPGQRQHVQRQSGDRPNKRQQQRRRTTTTS